MWFLFYLYFALMLRNVEGFHSDEFRAMSKSVAYNGANKFSQFAIMYVKQHDLPFNYEAFEENRISLDRNKVYNDDAGRIMATYPNDQYSKPATHSERFLLDSEYFNRLYTWIRRDKEIVDEDGKPYDVDLYIFTLNSPCCRKKYDRRDSRFLQQGTYGECTAEACVTTMVYKIPQLRSYARAAGFQLHVALSWDRLYWNQGMDTKGKFIVTKREAHQNYFTELNQLQSKDWLEGIYILGPRNWFQKQVVDLIIERYKKKPVVDIIKIVNKITAYCIMGYNGGEVKDNENIFKRVDCWREALARMNVPETVIGTISGIIATVDGDLGPPVSHMYKVHRNEYEMYSHDNEDLNYQL